MGVGKYFTNLIFKVHYRPTNIPLPSLRRLFYSIFMQPDADKNFPDRYWNNNDRKAFWLSRSSHALRLIVKFRLEMGSKQRINIWIPAYFCNESLTPLRKERVNLFFYPILKNGSPNLEVMEKTINEANKPDLFLAVHFFGNIMNFDKSIKFAKRFDAWFIEDAAHVLSNRNNLGEKSHFIFFSPHKLLAIPDGSILIINENKLSEDENYDNNHLSQIYEKFISSGRKNSFDLLLWTLKRILQKLGIRKKVHASLENFKENDSKVSTIFLEPSISNFSKKLITLYDDLNSECEIRIKNYNYWKQFFKDNKFFGEKIFSTNDPQCPYLFGIRLTNNSDLVSALKLLNEKNIPVSSWPDLPNEVWTEQIKFKECIDLKRQTLFLPVHSSLRIEKIKI